MNELLNAIAPFGTLTMETHKEEKTGYTYTYPLFVTNRKTLHTIVKEIASDYCEVYNKGEPRKIVHISQAHGYDYAKPFQLKSPFGYYRDYQLAPRVFIPSLIIYIRVTD